MQRYAIAPCFAVLGLMTISAAPADATTVRFETVLGDIDVQLFDTATPQTVANFMAYATGCDYVDTLFHRSASLPDGTPFVLQGGGFTYGGDPELDPQDLNDITARPTVQNEPGISNTRGTIAMAKLGGNPNSATSEFFFNLGDNSANLDFQNGGFTAFGQVLGNGMDVIDAFAALGTFNFGNNTAFADLPLRNFADADMGSISIDETNLALIHGIHTISDNAENSFLSELDLPALNTLLNATAPSAINADADIDTGLPPVVDTSAVAPSAAASSSSSASASAQAVPEPGTAAVILGSAAALIQLRKRRA